MKTRISVLSAALATLSAMVLQTHAATSTNDWFTASVSTYNEGTLPVGSGWTSGVDDASTVTSGHVIQLDTAGELLQFTPAEPSGTGTNAYVDLSIQFAAADMAPNISGVSAPQASLAVLDDNGTLTYIAYVGGSWVPLAGVSPDTNSFVDVRIEMDYASDNAPLVRYLIGGVALTNSGNEWLALSSAVSTKTITNIGFLGSGSVGNFSGKRIVEVEIAAFHVSINGTDTPIVIADTWIADNVGAGATPDQVNAYLAQDAANGQKKWKNYVLGVADNAPLYVDATQDGGANVMRISLNPTPSVVAAAGIAVAYRLERKVNGAWTKQGNDQASPVFDIDLTNGDASGNYRILAVFSAAD